MVSQDISIDLSEWAITYVKTILQFVLAWFTRILGSIHMHWLWLGAVVFVIVFSVILLPMRGGAMLGGGLMSDIAGSRIRSNRREARSEARYQAHQAARKSARQNSRKHTED